MLRLLSIRNFVVVDALDLELDGGFSVLTGETGAGKSILLDALALLLGDRFETRQLKPGADRAELAASFDVGERPDVIEWLDGEGLATDDGTLLVRRTLDAQGRSRAWINGRPATLAQLASIGERLVDLHGQHAHQSLVSGEAQRTLVDAFGGFSTLARETAAAWRAWREAAERRDAAAQAAQATTAEREFLAARAHELAALATRLAALATHDAALSDIVALIEPARIQLEEAARELRNYRQKLDVDPAELARVEERLAAIHDVARKYRVRPEQLPQLLAETLARAATLAESADHDALARRADALQKTYAALASQLSAKREFAADELSNRVTAAMQELAMAGGRFEIALLPLAEGASYGLEQVVFEVASHPKQPLGPLARVASGGELSRIALAVQVVTSEVGEVPTLIFDEVDVGIGGAVAATVGRLLQSLGTRRQVLCVTHLPQVAAFADRHFRVSKRGDAQSVHAEVASLGAAERVDELARMLAGSAITAKTRAHAKELLEQHRRGA